ncbi:orotidine 5'-phosphate decarboxylase [Arthrobotrys megalospora]
MASKSNLTYAARAKLHPHPVVKKLFETAEAKQSNLIISADMTNSKDLLELADLLGPYIAVFKTHIDLISDFSPSLVTSLKALSIKHNFMVFEDRKFVDIGATVQKQYHGGALRISEFAHVVNCSILAGEGIVQALSETMTDENFEYKEDRGLLLLAEMTTKGSMAVGGYTESCVNIARKYPDAVIGFVAMRALTEVLPATSSEEDFVVFTTGVNRLAKEDKLGQQYQTPKDAITRGSDFVIAGRGIYAAEDPVESAKAYQREAWEAYLDRTK